MVELRYRWIVAIPLVSGSKPISIVGPAYLLQQMGNPMSCGPSPGSNDTPFRVFLVSADGAPAKNGSVTIQCDALIREIPAPDLIYVPAMDGDWDRVLGENRPYLDWIRECHDRGTLVATACTGAVFLAEAGLLDGRQATTHWRFATFLASRYPKVRWQISRMVVEDGKVITAGGATAYFNLMIKLAEKFLGREPALSFSRFILVDPERDSQLPYMMCSDHPAHRDRYVQRAQELLIANPAKAVILADLAKCCGVSSRTLLRRFRIALGKSPREYLRELRIEKAKHLLEKTDQTVEEIVAEVGYDDSRSFRRLFRRYVGISPQAYRRKYGLIPAGAEFYKSRS